MVLYLEYSRHSINAHSLKGLIDVWKKLNKLMNLTQVSLKRLNILEAPSFPRVLCHQMFWNLGHGSLSNWLPRSSGCCEPRPLSLASVSLSFPPRHPPSSTASGSCWFPLIKAGRMASWAGDVFLSSAFHLCSSHFTQKWGRFIRSAARRLPLWLLVCLRLMNE